MNLPTSVRLVEVGPRDGLQNEKQPISVADKVRLVDDLTAAGLRYIEVGSFVSPKWVPQMVGSAEVFAGIGRKAAVTYAALTPNLKASRPRWRQTSRKWRYSPPPARPSRKRTSTAPLPRACCASCR